MKFKVRHRIRARRRGLSLIELLTTIAVIGTLSGVSIQSYSGLQKSARESVARDTLAILNRAVLHFSQTNWDLVLDPVNNATSDELAVLRTLQWRNPIAGQATPGSPYLPINFCDTMSSSDKDFRLAWNGRAFELLEPGTPGSGLLTGATSAASAGVYAFPSDYQPIGPGQHD